MTDLRKLQIIMLEILKEVDGICRRHGIKYYLTAGTLLGAVRHGGFIPWDDDVDIGMSLNDYKRFCKICEKELDLSRFFLQNADTDKHYRYIFAKIRLQNTLYVRKGQEHLKYHHGIPIDIWPAYPVPKNLILYEAFKGMVTVCKRILWSPVGAKIENAPIKRLGYKIMSLVPAKAIHKIIYKATSKASQKHLQDIGEPLFSKRKTTYKIRKKLQVRKVVEMEFEGYSFFVPANYRYILKQFYGDYMKLPPKNERIGHHQASVIDFGQYKEKFNESFDT